MTPIIIGIIAAVMISNFTCLLVGIRIGVVLNRRFPITLDWRPSSTFQYRSRVPRPMP